MNYILLDTIEQYNTLNMSVSTSRGYPYASTELYAPEVPEEYQVEVPLDVVEGIYVFDENGQPLTEQPTSQMVTKYKFPLHADIMVIVFALKGKALYDSNMNRIFASM